MPQFIPFGLVVIHPWPLSAFGLTPSPVVVEAYETVLQNIERAVRAAIGNDVPVIALPRVTTHARPELRRLLEYTSLTTEGQFGHLIYVGVFADFSLAVTRKLGYHPKFDKLRPTKRTIVKDATMVLPLRPRSANWARKLSKLWPSWFPNHMRRIEKQPWKTVQELTRATDDFCEHHSGCNTLTVEEFEALCSSS
jgi:hypothetical protein